MTTIDDETKEHKFFIEIDYLQKRCPLDTKFLLSLQKSYDEIKENEIQSAIEFLEAQGYKVIKN